VEQPAGLDEIHVQYLNHVFKTKPAKTIIDEMSTGYEDVLQTPLQPLMDHLDATTYDVFTEDPVKYNLYEEAAYQALLDRANGGNTDDPIVVMVVGAGSRGPLVDCVIRGAYRAECEHRVKIYAIEKNPNAYVTLAQQPTLCRLWSTFPGVGGVRFINVLIYAQITVIHSDVRAVKTLPDKADIIVSELLGSFGDNELSPV
jgi:protein arginine N-methyltransferase 5